MCSVKEQLVLVSKKCQLMFSIFKAAVSVHANALCFDVPIPIHC